MKNNGVIILQVFLDHFADSIVEFSVRKKRLESKIDSSSVFSAIIKSAVLIFFSDLQLLQENCI